jgi:hypothetical protein
MWGEKYPKIGIVFKTIAPYICIRFFKGYWILKRGWMSIRAPFLFVLTMIFLIL